MVMFGSGKSIPLGFGGVMASIGDHICHFYRGEAETLGILGPYVAEGIRWGDRCGVVCSSEVAERLRAWLAERGLDVPRAEGSGQLLVHPGEGTIEGMRILFERVEAYSLAAGYKFVRFAADMAWALSGGMSLPDLVRLEALADGWKPTLALCQYDLTRFGGDVVMDVLRSHPLCVIGQVPLSNPFHVAPEALLRELAECA